VFNRLSPRYLNVAFISLTIVVQAGCLLLFKLSQFGENPFPQLPLAVVVFFGALFVSGLLGLWQRLPSRHGLTLISAGVANLILWLFIQRLAPGAALYMLAPMVSVGLVLGYKRLFKKNAPMLAAMTVYVVCTILANFTLDSFLPLPGYGLINVGTLFFGITFTQRDRVHRYGRRYAYLMIGAALIANVVTAQALGTPWRYIVVSFVAILLAETADTEIYQRFINRGWWTRVATSNAVSIPIDTIIFTFFAFYGEPWATPGWMTEVMVTDIVVKLIVGFLAAIRIAGFAERRRSQAVS